MAQSTTTIESVWAAKGNLPDNAIVATADGKYPALDGSLITNISGGGSGDLLAANNLSELTATASVARTNLELGAADTVEFGGFVPPSGTTAEIDAVTTATIGQVMIDTDRNRSVRFTGAATYDVIGYTSSSTYYVDPQNGDDATGAVGGLPFVTINGALTQAVADAASPIIVQCLSGFYSEVDALNGISTAASVSITFDVGSIYFNSSMTGPFFDTTTATLSQLNYLGGQLSFNSNNYGFFKGAAGASTILEVEGVASAPTAGPMFEVTGGRSNVIVNGLADFSQAGAIHPVIVASGDAKVTCVGLNAFYADPFGSPVLPSSKLSGTATLKLTNVSIENAGLCEITSDTACKLIIRDCNCSDGFFPGTTLTVKAPAASTNPKAFALGVNAVPVAATDITVDVTFGQFIVDASADDLF
jgi:hypothetical protein